LARFVFDSFNQTVTRKLSGVFVRFRAPLHQQCLVGKPLCQTSASSTSITIPHFGIQVDRPLVEVERKPTKNRLPSTPNVLACGLTRTAKPAPLRFFLRDGSSVGRCTAQFV
jgi:hypothetical protein